MSGELSKFDNSCAQVAGSECWLGNNRFVCDLGGRVLLGGTVPSIGIGGDCCCGFPNVDGDHVAITVVFLMAVVSVESWGGQGFILGRGGLCNGRGLGIIVWVVVSFGLVLS